jgi:hypothetical protein
MKDAAYKTILKDSFALSGTRVDIPLPAIMIGESKFNAGIYSDMDKVRLKVNSNASEDGFVRIVSRDGKIIYQNTYNIRPGENNIEIDPGHLSQGIYIVDYMSRTGRKSAKVVAGFDGMLNGSSPESVMKSAEIENFMFIVSNSKLLTDTFFCACLS